MSAIANQIGTQNKSRPHLRIGRLAAKVIPLFFAIAVAMALVLGWAVREEEYLTPKSGLWLLARNLWQFDDGALNNLFNQKKSAVPALAWADPAMVSCAHGARDHGANIDHLSF